VIDTLNLLEQKTFSDRSTPADRRKKLPERPKVPHKQPTKK